MPIHIAEIALFKELLQNVNKAVFHGTILIVYTILRKQIYFMALVMSIENILWLNMFDIPKIYNSNNCKK